MKLIANPGRCAGFLYLLSVITAPISLIYIPDKLFVHGNAAATAANLVAHEALFRTGMAVDLFDAALEVFLVLALYWLFKGIDKRTAVLMLILGAVPVLGAYVVTVMSDAIALMLARGADFLSAFDKPQRDALSMLFLRIDSQATLAVMLFWGLWLFPLGLLVYGSRSIPRFLGVWLILNGIAYVVQSFAGFLWPQYEAALSNYLFPVQFGEVAFMLWLLIKGIKQPEQPRADLPEAPRVLA